MEIIVSTIDKLDDGLADSDDLLMMAVEEDEQESVDELVAELDDLDEHLAKLEFRRMFSGEMDTENAYIDIQSGSGGTEAQDWADM